MYLLIDIRKQQEPQTRSWFSQQAEITLGNEKQIKQWMLGELSQQRCCSSPLCLRRAAGGKGDTRRMPPLCQRALPKSQRAEGSQHWKRWKLAQAATAGPVGGGLSISAAAGDILLAHGRWFGHPLPSGRPESSGDTRGPRINPAPCSFVPLPPTLPSHPLLHHPCLVFLNRSSVTPG